jgi:hypothetical protein
MVCRVRWTHAVMHESWFASLEKSTFYIEEHTARERGRRRREPGVIRELYSVALIFFFFGGQRGAYSIGRETKHAGVLGRECFFFLT